jgi:thioredoxin reductase
MYDVIIVGGGPAGLSGAMVLGRCRRKVAVFNSGKTRNHASHAMHSFLSRDGSDPLEFLSIGKQELKKYGIKVFSKWVSSAIQKNGGFEVTDDNGEKYYCKKLLLCTGIKDNLPPIKNIEKFYGTSVFHCPYCDGWENRDRPIFVYGKGKNALGLSISLKTWTNQVVLLTDGRTSFNPKECDRLLKAKIRIIQKKIDSVEGKKGQLERIKFMDGTSEPLEVLFFNNGYEHSSNLFKQLNCTVTKRGVVRADKFQQTNVPGLYVAGDAARDMQLVIVAAAEGTKAGVAINMAMQSEEG